MSLRLALIGHPVKHSLSPPMHRAAFLSLNIAGTYELIDVPPADLNAALDRLQTTLSGWNVTVPHKEAMFDYILKRENSATLTPEAILLGAVNTVRVDSTGHLHGHNTDMPGFARCVQMIDGPQNEISSTPASSKAAAVLGAGGAARACIGALALCGYESIIVFARDQAKTQALCTELEAKLGKTKLLAADINHGTFNGGKSFDLIVNTTPIGLTSEDVPPIVQDLFRPRSGQTARQQCFIDTVYRKDSATTTLCELADGFGLANCDGRRMLIEQAVLAFEFWTGHRPASELYANAIGVNQIQANTRQ